MHFFLSKNNTSTTIDDIVEQKIHEHEASQNKLLNVIDHDVYISCIW